MNARQAAALRWTMRVLGAALIGFVLLIGLYLQFAAPSVGDGARNAPGDTGPRYIVSGAMAASCIYSAESGQDLTLRVDRSVRSFVSGTGFRPAVSGGVLTCDQKLRIARGVVASLSEVAEHEFLVAFPGVVLVASAQLVRPRKRNSPLDP